MPSLSKATLFTGAILPTLWLAANCLLASRFNMASGDSILYTLPLAVEKNPFDLGVPFLNDFNGFGTSWSHQWPGAMWLLGLVSGASPIIASPTWRCGWSSNGAWPWPSRASSGTQPGKPGPPWPPPSSSCQTG